MEEAKHLLETPKKVMDDKGELLDSLIIEQKFPLSHKWNLVALEDVRKTFLFEAQQSTKNKLRLSFHYQEQRENVGLLRIDYHAGHRNPTDVNEFVPGVLKPYAGKLFSNTEHHIHYHVEGYPSLAWAVPLEVDSFAVKSIEDNAGMNHTIANVIHLFATRISLKTELRFIPLLL